MNSLVSRYPAHFHRFFEIIFPLLTWGIITLPFWLSPFHPAVVAYILLSFNVYFFYKSLSVTIYSTLSYLKLKKMSRINWLMLARKNRSYAGCHHVIIITNYRETVAKVRRTLEYLTRQDFTRKRLLIVLAM